MRKVTITHLEWIRIPAGRARIGSTLAEIDRANEEWKSRLLEPRYVEVFRDWLLKEYPQHEVWLGSFEISDILVTNRMYREYSEATGNRLPESIWSPELAGMDDHPVWGVTFEEAKQYCVWLSEQLGYEVRLPSEAEWEYAARGGTDREYPWGSGFDPALCNTHEAGVGKTTSVRHYSEGRSLFGLYDMGGNVEEWVDDLYAPYRGGDLVVDDLVEALGMKYPVLKGGSFARGGDLARVARRHGGFPDPVFRFTGFRLVRDAQGEGN
ncbi:formylglycine-generating enzyme family protein [Tumebacillus lipolyticus]|uniref:Formylglycine-generating enzyme family protein n=1 Tax=Tumebacillus lipolyticus TaxID=1280370 RepID=A0ABW5A1W1_9BACL